MRFGMPGTVPLARDAARLADLRSALAPAAPEGVELVTAKDYRGVADFFIDGALDLAWLPPALVADAGASGAIAHVATAVRRGSAHYTGALIVREDAPYVTVNDLRGARVGWVERWSAGGYLFPRQLLRDALLDPRALFASEAFYGAVPAVVDALVAGAIDVGAVYAADDGRLPRAARHASRTTPMRALARTASFPCDALCVSARADASRRDALVNVLHGECANLLASIFDADRFYPLGVDDYRPVARALEAERA